MSDQTTIIVLSVFVGLLTCCLGLGIYYHYRFKNRYSPRYVVHQDLEEPFLPSEDNDL